AGICCFFFQAEDGIRDRNVTGVQTCALPILSPELRVPLPSRSMTSMCVAPSAENRWNMIVSPWLTVKVGPGFVMFTGPSPQPLRSEERRVGKECGARVAGARHMETFTEAACR